MDLVQMVSMEDFFDDVDACPSRELCDKVKQPWEMVNAEKPELRQDKTKLLGNLHESVVINEEKGGVLSTKGRLLGPLLL
jgi:hypothetical protein